LAGAKLVEVQIPTSGRLTELVDIVELADDLDCGSRLREKRVNFALF